MIAHSQFERCRIHGWIIFAIQQVVVMVMVFVLVLVPCFLIHIHFRGLFQYFFRRRYKFEATGIIRRRYRFLMLQWGAAIVTII
jgi:hypothetical protein